MELAFTLANSTHAMRFLVATLNTSTAPLDVPTARSVAAALREAAVRSLVKVSREVVVPEEAVVPEEWSRTVVVDCWRATRTPEAEYEREVTGGGVGGSIWFSVVGRSGISRLCMWITLEGPQVAIIGRVGWEAIRTAPTPWREEGRVATGAKGRGIVGTT